MIVRGLAKARQPGPAVPLRGVWASWCLAGALAALLLNLTACESAQRAAAQPSETGTGVRVAESVRAGALVKQVRAVFSASGKAVQQQPFSPAGVVGFHAYGDHVRPLLDASVVRRSRAPASVELPRSADGEVTIRDRGFSASHSRTSSIATARGATPRSSFSAARTTTIRACPGVDPCAPREQRTASSSFAGRAMA